MAVTSPAPANAPASRPRQNLGWSRLHFVIRLLGITGALVGCAGLVLAAVKGELGQLNAVTSWRDAGTVGVDLARTALDDAVGKWPTVLLLAGGAVALFALLVEVLVILCFTASRRSAFGFNALLQGALAAVLLVGVNVWSFRHYESVDFTRDQQYTLPPEVRKDLRHLDPTSKTTVIVYDRHKTFGSLNDKKSNAADQTSDEYDSAAGRKVVERIKDLADQLRAQEARQLKVEVLDSQVRGFKDRLEQLTANAPELRKAIQAAPENSLFFYAQGANGAAYLQRLSFNDFYLLDKTASQNDRGGRGNLVLLYQGLAPFARRLTHLEEKRPRVGIAVIHKVLSTSSDHNWGLKGLRLALEQRGFEVEDIVLKKWSRFAPPSAAASTADESALERLEERQRVLERLIANVERQRPVFEKSLSVWKKAVNDQKTRDDLTRQLAAQLDGNKVTEEMAAIQVAILQANLEDIDKALPKDRQRLEEVKEDKSKLNVPALKERQRMTDVKAKMARLLADCDLLIVPRLTLRNVADENENIPARFYKMDDAQVEAIKDFLKAGKPVLTCFGPSNPSPDEGPGRPGEDRADGLEELLTQVGVKFGKETVLFDSEVEALADSRAGAELGGGQFEAPPALFDWMPGAGRPIGAPLVSDKPNRIRESLRLTARALGKDAEGKPLPLDIRIRHPRPIYFVPLKGTKVAFDPDILMTNPRSWNEDQPFPTADSVPQFEKAKGRDKNPGLIEPSKEPLDTRRRGPFPIGIAIETLLPSSWYGSASDKPATVRLAVIGQGGFFTGQELPPAQEELFVDTINWLLGRDDLLPRDEGTWSYPRVNDTIPPDSEREYLWLWGVRLGLPVLFAFFGLVVLLFRRLR